jgi:tetratricopeptide (TPR) repeat protein
VGRLYGAAALLAGNVEEAESYCREALASTTRARFRPELALSHLQLAEVLMALGDAGAPARDRDPHDEALEHLDFAIEEFRAMKMQPSLERALSHKGLLKA